VKIYYAFDLEEAFTLTPFAGFSREIRVATGDVNLDGTPEVITAPGPGMQGQVRVFNGVDGTPLPGSLDSILPFGP
jgi:hypothetical protein